jgi:hypothetical protein
MNVLMPLFAVVLISMFDLSPAVRIALVALSFEARKGKLFSGLGFKF